MIHVVSQQEGAGFKSHAALKGWSSSEHEQLRLGTAASRWKQETTHLLSIVFREDVGEAQLSHLCEGLEDTM